MRFISLFTVLLFTVMIQAQDKRGYYVTESGQRVEGFFKDADFLKSQNPEFRTLPGGEYVKLSPSTVKEYGIEDEYKFERHSVKVDLSQSVSLNTYSTVKEPQWEKQTIFLNVITEGDATLYSAYVGEETKYFYSVKSKNILPAQLVYKKYSNGVVIKENSEFRQELFLNINCNSNADAFSKIAYNKKSLVTAIDKYNACNGGTESKLYDNKSQKEQSLKFTVGAGINMNRFILDADGFSDKDSKIAPSIAAEVAFVMPYSRFGLFARLDYTKAKGEVLTKVNYTDYLMRGGSLDANFIGVMVGPRFYFSKHKAEKGFFLDAGPGFSFGGGKVERTGYSVVNGELVPGTTLEYDVNASIFIGAGLGYNINKKFGVDVRYETNRAIISNLEDFRFGKMGVNIRYTLN